MSEFPNYLQERFTFLLNDEVRQQDIGQNMRMHPAEIISYISEFFPLVAGDLIFTGTPAGVGEIKPGQKGLLKFGDINYSIIWKRP